MYNPIEARVRLEEALCNSQKSLQQKFPSYLHLSECKKGKPIHYSQLFSQGTLPSSFTIHRYLRTAQRPTVLRNLIAFLPSSITPASFLWCSLILTSQLGLCSFPSPFQVWSLSCSANGLKSILLRGRNVWWINQQEEDCKIPMGGLQKCHLPLPSAQYQKVL